MRAAALDSLADLVPSGSITYRHFEAVLDELREAGFWPENALVSEVGRAFHAVSDLAS